eukprot:CAMPEP_0174275340 /NCGR_PEP_ID=MMETSP0439-20130205/59769_1 /TAXON_ID=0 /ORGANISM="Stereomyxa ramosa, Strain Chinc5" /LENGTH=955 /DNA_ID=CAMNT_0015367433 /DNA_START=97 /DNA_END=2960 /DNA_ORIENTATION=+
MALASRLAFFQQLEGEESNKDNTPPPRRNIRGPQTTNNNNDNANAKKEPPKSFSPSQSSTDSDPNSTSKVPPPKPHKPEALRGAKIKTGNSTGSIKDRMSAFENTGSTTEKQDQQELKKKEEEEREKLEQKEKELKEKAQKEKETQEKELQKQKEQEQKEKEQKEKEQKEKEQKEKEQKEKELMEKEQQEKEQKEKEQKEKELKEKEQKEKEQKEKEQKEEAAIREQKEKEQKEKDEKEKEAALREQKEKEQKEKNAIREQKEKEQKEKKKKEKIKREQEEQERETKEKESEQNESEQSKKKNRKSDREQTKKKLEKDKEENKESKKETETENGEVSEKLKERKKKDKEKKKEKEEEETKEEQEEKKDTEKRKEKDQEEDDRKSNWSGKQHSERRKGIIIGSTSQTRVSVAKNVSNGETETKPSNEDEQTNNDVSESSPDSPKKQQKTGKLRSKIKRNKSKSLKSPRKPLKNEEPLKSPKREKKADELKSPRKQRKGIRGRIKNKVPGKKDDSGKKSIAQEEPSDEPNDAKPDNLTPPAARVERTYSISGQAWKLLDWCKERTADYEGVEVYDLCDSWKDGLALCALIHSYEPKLIDFDSLDPSNGAQNLRMAFGIAHKNLGVKPQVSVSKLLESDEDSGALLTYLLKLHTVVQPKTTTRVKVAPRRKKEKKGCIVMDEKTDMTKEKKEEVGDILSEVASARPRLAQPSRPVRTGRKLPSRQGRRIGAGLKDVRTTTEGANTGTNVEDASVICMEGEMDKEELNQLRKQVDAATVDKKDVGMPQIPNWKQKLLVRGRGLTTENIEKKEDEEGYLEGFLFKKSHHEDDSSNEWKKLWFVLKGPHLIYYANRRTKENMNNLQPMGILSLEHVAKVLPDFEKENSMIITDVADGNYHMYADTEEELEIWITALGLAKDKYGGDGKSRESFYPSVYLNTEAPSEAALQWSKISAASKSG